VNLETLATEAREFDWEFNFMNTERDMTKLIKASPSEFRRRFFIECDGQVKRLAEVEDDWQRRDFEALDPGWQLAAGLKVDSRQVYQRAYLERPRGHSKTTDIAIASCWAIYSAPRPIRGVIVAGDEGQGR
jgi:hypothetical protein